MFSDNKYSTWYFSIVNHPRTTLRKKGDGTYYEKHHIIPKCLGGDNTNSNLVLLTYKEHFICHWLLTKMVTTKNAKIKMAYAFSYMVRRTTTQERNYTIAQKTVMRKVLAENTSLHHKGLKKPGTSKGNMGHPGRTNKSWKIDNIQTGEIFFTNNIVKFGKEMNLNCKNLYEAHRTGSIAYKKYKLTQIEESVYLSCITVSIT